MEAFSARRIRAEAESGTLRRLLRAFYVSYEIPIKTIYPYYLFLVARVTYFERMMVTVVVCTHL